MNLCKKARSEIKGAGGEGSALTSLVLSNYYQKFINSKQLFFTSKMLSLLSTLTCFPYSSESII